MSRTAIVTGAGSGIGQATAILLAQAGWQVALVGRSRQNLEHTAHLIHEATPQANTQVIVADLVDEQSPGRIVEETVGGLGGADALAHVAGDAPLLKIEQVTAEIWRRCIDTNVSSALLLAAKLWPIFVARGGGVFVNVSSLASVDPFPGLEIYGCAKAGLNALSVGLARQGAKLNIRAVSVAPGAVETPMLRRLFSTKVLPASRTLQPQQVGQVIVDCITGQRAFAPGELILLPSP